MYIYRKGRSVFVKQNKIPQILLPCTPLTSAGHLAEVTENMALPVAPPMLRNLEKMSPTPSKVLKSMAPEPDFILKVSQRTRPLSFEDGTCTAWHRPGRMTREGPADVGVASPPLTS